MFSPPSSLQAEDSLRSNPESPLSPGSVQDSFKDVDSSDIDFSSKAFVNELLECGLKEERFRIDRKKLEDMLQAQRSIDADENAEVFFQRVMIETSTQISWPSKLKIGAKSKKDPHVKIVGKPESVQMAKERILEILDTKKNRVTLKMDVSHSDHSYIIGKGGFKIQQVMEETGCHIHFPDSNRNSTAEKSNQVSIAGQATGVEFARSKIRDLLPLVFTFELPNGDSVKPGDECSPAIQHIQQTYSFNVAFRPVGPLGLGRTLLVVRGCQRLLSRLRQGLALLMEYLTGSKTIPVMGFMKTEIAAQHHQFVIGPGNANIQMIMNKTGASVIFPDATPLSPFGADSLTQPVPVMGGHSVLRSKSTVLIQGSFDSVCLAWQELLKCLPLVLMFDLKEGQELDPVMVNNFMEAFNINIMVRPKMKENTKSVLIRGAEKDSKVLFQVRKDILGLDDDETCSSPNFSQTGFRSVGESFGSRHSYQEFNDINKGMTTVESLNFLGNIIQQNPQIVGLLNNLSTAYPPNAPAVSPAQQMPNYFYRNVMVPNQMPFKHYQAKNVENWINRPDRTYAFSSGVNVSNFLQRDRQLPMDDGDSGIFIPSHNKFFNGLDSKSDLSSHHPSSSASSTSSNDTPDYKSSGKIPHDSCDVPQCTRKLMADYGNKKLSASKVMQQQADGVRTPNSLWSGYGFSKSMPEFALKDKKTQNAGSMSEYLEADKSNVTNVEAAAAKAWNTVSVQNESPMEKVSSPFALSNFWENVPKPPINYSSIKTLEQLMCVLDLEKYNEIFEHHEIDLQVFLSLTELDLQKLNISYGARRKMLTAVSALRERLGDWNIKNFRAAPGAERKTCYTSRFSSSSYTDEN